MRIRARLISLALLLLLPAITITVAASGLGPGASGQAVRRLQQDLAFLGYLACLPTGYYGAQTTTAVKSFQRTSRLNPDGYAGTQTLTILAQRVRDKSTNLTSRRNDSVGILPWSEVDRLFPRGATARVWDVESGKCFLVWRLQGTYHADVEPLTKTDTAILLAASGGHWRTERRPALVEIQGRLVAASMYAYPHGNEAIHDNGFNGQLCLHFLGSRVHKSGRVDPAHQEAIMRAAQAYRIWQVPAASPPPVSVNTIPEIEHPIRVPMGVLRSQ